MAARRRTKKRSASRVEASRLNNQFEEENFVSIIEKRNNHG